MPRKLYMIESTLISYTFRFSEAQTFQDFRNSLLATSKPAQFPHLSKSGLFTSGCRHRDFSLRPRVLTQFARQKLRPRVALHIHESVSTPPRVEITPCTWHNSSRERSSFIHESRQRLWALCCPFLSQAADGIFLTEVLMK